MDLAGGKSTAVLCALGQDEEPNSSSLEANYLCTSEPLLGKRVRQHFQRFH